MPSMIADITFLFSTATSGRIPVRIMSKRRTPSPLNSRARSFKHCIIHRAAIRYIFFQSSGSLCRERPAVDDGRYVLALPSSPNATHFSQHQVSIGNTHIREIDTGITISFSHRRSHPVPVPLLVRRIPLPLCTAVRMDCINS